MMAPRYPANPRRRGGSGFNLLRLVTAGFFTFLTAGARAASSPPKVRRVCLVSPALPWTFGPYQAQMYELSLLLADRGYDIYFMIHVVANSFPAGMYRSYAEVKPMVPGIVEPPRGFRLDHIKGYVGKDIHEYSKTSGSYGEGKVMFSSALNKLAATYKFDVIITLSDIVHIIPDVPSTCPCVGWVPIHLGSIPHGSAEFFALQHFDALAILSPSSASSVAGAMEGLVEDVKFVPHSMNRRELEEWATSGLRSMAEMSSQSASDAFRIERFGESLNWGDGNVQIPHPLFVDPSQRDTFVVLMQGGNYDEQDRKGWDTSLQSYARFYAANNGVDGRRVHLYVHSMESFLIQQDTNRGKPPPAALQPKGLNILRRLKGLGVPRSAFTLDMYQHEPEVVAAFKRRADVCLHPSKVEGFGMNVLECQALGTPVITTNYTANGDFTRYGITVPFRQTIYPPQAPHDIALPDVEGITEALGKVYDNFLRAKNDPAAAKVRAADVEDSRRWIDENFGREMIGDAFGDLIKSAASNFQRRNLARAKTIAKGVPHFDDVPMFRVVYGDYPEIVDWDEPFTLLAPRGLEIPEKGLQASLWKFLMKKAPDVTSVAVRTMYKDGSGEVPFMDDYGSLHSHMPVILRTYLLSGMQTGFTRRVSLAQMGLDHSMKRNTAQQLMDATFSLDRAVAEGTDDTIFDYYYAEEKERPPRPKVTAGTISSRKVASDYSGEVGSGSGYGSSQERRRVEVPPSPPQAYGSGGAGGGGNFRVFDDDDL